MGISRPVQFLLIALALIAGILLGRFGWSVEFNYVLAALASAAATLRLAPRLGFGLLIASVLLFGVWRGWETDFSRSMLNGYIDKKVDIVGVISDDPGTDRYGNYAFEIDDVRLNDQPVGYPVRIKSLKSGLSRGQQVLVKGKLRPAKGIIPVQISFAEVEVIQSDVSPLEKMRQRFFGAIRTHIPPTLNGFGLGLLVGARSLIPGDLQDEMSSVGLSHILAASGYNLTILVMAMQRALAGVSLYVATAAAGWLIGAFIIISGFSAAIFRAAAVSSLGMLTSYYGYRAHPLTLLSVPAVVTLAWNPDFLMRDLGWQLSFTAFYGVLVLAPLIEQRFIANPSIIKSILIESTCAHIMTLPLIMWRFENMSIIAPIANLFVLPLVPLAMLLTFVTGIAGMVLPHGLASTLALPATGVLGYCIGTAQLFAGLPFTQVSQSMTAPMVGGFYILMLVITLILKRPNARLEARSSLLAGVQIR